jgi:hypothetical protein
LFRGESKTTRNAMFIFDSAKRLYSCRIYSCLLFMSIPTLFDQGIYYEACRAKRLLTFQMLWQRHRTVCLHTNNSLKMVAWKNWQAVSNSFSCYPLTKKKKPRDTNKDANAKWCPCSLGVQTASHHEVNDLFQTSMDTVFRRYRNFWVQNAHTHVPHKLFPWQLDANCWTKWFCTKFIFLRFSPCGCSTTIR